MLTKDKVQQVVEIIASKYNFKGNIVLFDTKPESKVIKLAFDIVNADGGALNGLKMSKEIKSAFGKDKTVQITSPMALNSPERAKTFVELRRKVKQGTVIYGKNNS